MGAIIYEHLKKTVVFCDAVPFFGKISPLSFYCVPFCLKNNQSDDGIGLFLFWLCVSLVKKVLFTVQRVLSNIDKWGQCRGGDGVFCIALKTACNIMSRYLVDFEGNLWKRRWNSGSD